MKKLIYILLLFSTIAKSQTTIPECGMTVRDTLVTQYVDFGSCNLLIMADASYLKIEYLQGSGDIRYKNPKDTVPIIEFTTCYPYQQGNVHIDNSITIITPAGCETLSVEDINPNDYNHLNYFNCVVYSNTGQKVYEGKFGLLNLTTIGIYYAKFDYFTLKIPKYNK